MGHKDTVKALIGQFRLLADSLLKGCPAHDLPDILVLARSAVMSGAESWNDIEDRGRARKEWLRRHLRLCNGIPGHDTIRQVLEAILPRQPGSPFAVLGAQVCPATGVRIIAIDGKSLRGLAHHP